MRPSRLPLVASLVAAIALPAVAPAQELESWAALRRTPMAAMPVLAPGALGAMPDSARRFGIVGAGGGGQLVVASTGWFGRTHVALAFSDVDTLRQWRARSFGVAAGRVLARWVPWSDAASLTVGVAGGVGWQPDRVEDRTVLRRAFDDAGQPITIPTTVSLRSGPFRSVTASLPITAAWHPQLRPDDARALALRAYLAPVVSSGWRGRHERPAIADDGSLVARGHAGRSAGDLFLAIGARIDGPWGLGVDVARRQAPETSDGFSGWSASLSWTIPMRLHGR